MIPMLESPRIRRLRSDQRSLEKLRSDSSILDFVAAAGPPQAPPEVYSVRFWGKGLWRPPGSADVLLREHHEVGIRLGASYPRMMPELSWKTPIFHPNISASGIVCLGGYGTHWVPGLTLAELCIMLWDIVRYENFDVASPYNREAAYWVKLQRPEVFPVDVRPLRDRVAGLAPHDRPRKPPIVAQPAGKAPVVPPAEVIEAEIVESSAPDILYIE